MTRLLLLFTLIGCDGGVPVDDDDALPDGTPTDTGRADGSTGGTGGLPDLDMAPDAEPDDAEPDDATPPDAALPDRDGDGIPDATDTCPATTNPDQSDADGDGLGDACDVGDADGDGIPDRDDTCPLFAGPTPDGDGDGIGDACDVCPQAADPEQTDTDTDGIGDACEIPGDNDADGVPDATDNCPHAANGDQADGDSDGVGTLCDICPQDPDPAQLDTDADGLGDGCDVCPNLPLVAENHTDRDGDGQPTCAGDCDDSNPLRAAGLAERCDDTDNDCDRAVDEDFPELAAPCAVGMGSCRVEGRQVCSPDARTSTCDVQALAPAPEQCNDLDDDCDGMADEALPDCCEPGERQPCGSDEGVCVRGEQICSPQGSFEDCDGVDPTPEQCNGLDDDCDAQVDEAFDLQSDSRHCGGCDRACGAGEVCRLGQCALEALRDCAHLRMVAPAAASGIYRIQPDLNHPAFDAWCDMDTQGGGWTELARYPFAAGPDPFPGRNAREAWVFRADLQLDQIGRGAYQHDFRKFIQSGRLNPASLFALASGDLIVVAERFDLVAAPRPDGQFHVRHGTFRIADADYVIRSPCLGRCCENHTVDWDLPIFAAAYSFDNPEIINGTNQPAYGWVDVGCNLVGGLDTTPAWGARDGNITPFADDFVIMYR